MRCPVCKADNAAGPACRRCKADLALLWALEAGRARDLAAAARCLREGRAAAALEYAGRARAARDGADARRALAAAHLLARDFPAALRLGVMTGAYR